MRNFQKHPDVAQATRVGEPTLVDPQVVSATSVVQEATRAMMGSAAPRGQELAWRSKLWERERLPPDQPAPRSDTPAPETPAHTGGQSGCALPADAERTEAQRRGRSQ